MYHSIDAPTDDRERNICLPPAEFGRQMEYLHAKGYMPISLDLLLDASSRGGELPFCPVVITFDDGYADNAVNALPVLQRYGFPATVFVVSGCMGGNNTWDAARLPERRLLSWDKVREINKNGIAIGSHTLTHRRLSKLVPEDALAEIRESKQAIEEQLGLPVRHFAYPYGDTSESIAAMVRKAGYRTACTTMSGFNWAELNPFSLRRLDIYGTDTLPRFARKLAYGSNDGSIMTSLRYYGRRLLARTGMGR
jgi:peptidoglycan/xylan/chitin deacetylase (PgdA/CDA1 family)